MMKILPVLLAGGSGTRLWPLSREQYPKQFLRLSGDMTLLQQSAFTVDVLDRRMGGILIALRATPG